jgi:hypothetical protein
MSIKNLLVDTTGKEYSKVHINELHLNKTQMVNTISNATPTSDPNTLLTDNSVKTYVDDEVATAVHWERVGTTISPKVDGDGLAVNNIVPEIGSTMQVAGTYMENGKITVQHSGIGAGIIVEPDTNDNGRIDIDKVNTSDYSHVVFQDNGTDKFLIGCRGNNSFTIYNNNTATNSVVIDTTTDNATFSNQVKTTAVPASNEDLTNKLYVDSAVPSAIWQRIGTDISPINAGDSLKIDKIIEESSGNGVQIDNSAGSYTLIKDNKIVPSNGYLSLGTNGSLFNETGAGIMQVQVPTGQAWQYVENSVPLQKWDASGQVMSSTQTLQFQNENQDKIQFDTNWKVATNLGNLRFHNENDTTDYISFRWGASDRLRIEENGSDCDIYNPNGTIHIENVEIGTGGIPNIENVNKITYQDENNSQKIIFKENGSAIENNQHRFGIVSNWSEYNCPSGGNGYRWQFGGTDEMVLNEGSLVLTNYLNQEGIFSEIYVADASTAQSIPNGVTYTKSTAFTTNGQSANCTADATNDKITITQTGRYKVSGAFSATAGTVNLTWRGAVFLNGVEQSQIHWKRKITTTTDAGSMSCTGFVDVTSVPWDLDFRLRHDDTVNANFTMEYGNLNVLYVGST